MIPTRETVLKMIRESERGKSGCGWLEHSLTVGEVAEKIAIALNKAGNLKTPLDVDKITVMGYLHDIGKTIPPVVEHPYNGYKYMQELGYDEDICIISITHSFANNNAYCTFGEYMEPERDKFVIDFLAKYRFTLADKIISFSDSISSTEPAPLEKRIIDVNYRYGTCKYTLERIKAAYKIKHEIDKLLGYNVYELFPEIMREYAMEVSFLDAAELAMRLARKDLAADCKLQSKK